MPPVCDAISVLMPTSRPRRSTSGPPLLPGLIEASVCTQTMGDSGSSWRATAPMMPSVTEFVQPERAAEREHELTRLQVVRVGERHRRQLVAVDLDDGEIRLEIDADDLRADDVGRARRESDVPAAGRGTSTRMRPAPRTTCALVTM